MDSSGSPPSKKRRFFGGASSRTDENLPFRRNIFPQSSQPPVIPDVEPGSDVKAEHTTPLDISTYDSPPNEIVNETSNGHITNEAVSPADEIEEIQDASSGTNNTTFDLKTIAAVLGPDELTPEMLKTLEKVSGGDTERGKNR